MWSLQPYAYCRRVKTSHPLRSCLVYICIIFNWGKASVNNRLFYVLIPGRQKKSSIMKKDAPCPIRTVETLLLLQVSTFFRISLG
ncbi:hypothetical protein OIU76_008729 [Salix suchowensis]|nr:hypothetical protein OIU76_008729 [Salix suchowensis]